MTQELEIIAVSPDTVFISGEGLTEQDALDAVDKTLDDLEQTGNIQNVDTAIDTLVGIQKIAGKALAKLLYGTGQWWSRNNQGRNFLDHLESRHGMSRTYADRCITVWECIETKAIPDDVAVRPLRELIPIAKTISHGHEIKQKQWDRLVKATSLSEIGDILRGIKNKPPRKSSMQIYWNRKGDLEVWKDNKKHFIGFLDKDVYDKDDVAKKAIDRILDGAGVIRK